MEEGKVKKKKKKRERKREIRLGESSGATERE